MTDRELLVLIARLCLRMADYTFNALVVVNKGMLPLQIVSERQAMMKECAPIVKELEAQSQTSGLETGDVKSAN